MKMTQEEMQNYFPTVFPKMFVGKYGGISCDVGWFNIINQLCQNIQSRIDWHPEVEQVVVEQVKEKFGGLRFYITGGDDFIQGLVRMAESMSGVTCESCGNPGESRNGGWIHTYCDTCESQHQAEKHI
jgi:hypothetical protein